ncbi:EamA family transporter [Phenylobacterium sp.]|uniref:EamA family transporter n=1 Tax=Phenylobacterium sp. TaxID=1871053 RepID=UPI00286C067D|nr:EamA family transporter [Phenylobacterium sp.]
MTRAALPWSHVLLALAVVAVWGTNFVVIRIGLDHLPPLTFAVLRFTFALLPAVFFLKKPDVPWRNLAAYGVLIGAGQFGVLYIAISGYISPGLASLVVQTQVFFTIGLAMWIAKERIRTFQIVALALAAIGLLVIVAHTDASVTPLGLALVLLAAASWAGGNAFSKAAGQVNMLSYVVWASLFSVPPLLVLALVFEGPSAMLQGIQNADAATWAAVIWQSVGNTLFGYAAWGWLLSRHPAATITPMAMLVPVFGMGASAIWLGESLPDWKLLAAGLVMSGLALNVFWPAMERRFARV